MIDLNNLQSYRENNRIVAKKALGGFPQSVWETYSAFANTLGGIILLGVEEYPDRSLHAVNLPHPEELVKEFWDTLNDQTKVSANILSPRNIGIEEVGGNRIIVITVPRAQRFDKPVYIGGNPYGGTYRRSGEGDYKIFAEEVQSLLRDAALRSPDTRLLGDISTDVFDFDSVRRYRVRMALCRPGHVWEELDDRDFLYKTGAADKGADGLFHPTAAGLLMFGHDYEIIKYFPYYFLDYREGSDDDAHFTYRINSGTDDWSGNLFDFYFRVCDKITQGIEESAADECVAAPVKAAIREALANCLVNADYYGRRGIEIVKTESEITFSNPGNFRLDIEEAKSGGISDPRNTTLVKMFNLLSIGGRTGNGIPGIFSAWRSLKLPAPVFSEKFKPERTTLTLPLKGEINPGGKKAKMKNRGKSETIKAAIQKENIIRYLTDHAAASDEEIGGLLDVGLSRAQAVLAELIADGIVAADVGASRRIYRLKR